MTLVREGRRNISTARLLFAGFLAVLLFSGVAAAQILYGVMTGTVTDPAGAAIPKAHVKAQNVGTNEADETDTDANGNYRFQNLQPGTYTVTVSASGFGTKELKQIQVNPNSTARVDASLSVAQASSSITVVDEAPLLKTDRADVSVEMDKGDIKNLPVVSVSGVGRNFQSLYRVLPGFTPPAEQNSAGGNPQRSMTSNVNGNSMQSNQTRIDGVGDVYTWLPANVAYVPPADSIETVNVVTNSYDAEQGMAGGSAINVIIKSGTNQFHGTAYEYHNDQALNAKNFFNPAGFRKPKSILNQYGETLGGPIVKNKLFFFEDWEGTHLRQFASKGLLVPNPTVIFDPSGNVSFQNLTLNGNPVNIYDPNTGAANGTGRQIIMCNGVPNVICANRIDPASLTLLQRINTANFVNNNGLASTSNNYFSNASAPFTRNTGDVKINYLPSTRWSIFGRYSISGSDIFDPPALGNAGGDATNGGQNGDATSRIQSVGIGTSYTITNNILIDANVGYTRQRIDAFGPDLALGNFGLDVLKIPGTNGPDPLQAGIPAFQITGYANMGNPNTGNPFLFRDNQYVFNTNLSWTKGRHDMRFGYEMLRSGINHFQPQGGSFQTARGSFRFTGGPTALNGGPAPNQYNALAQYLLGFPDEVGKAIQNVNPNSLRFWSFAFYARDRWQITNRLTLTYGLRWEYYPAPTSDHGGVRLFIPSTGNVIIGGNGGIPDDDNIDVGVGQFNPRLGIAYRLASKTVVRAGYGINSDNNNFRFLRNAYPAVTNTDFTGSSVFASSFAPGASLTGEALVPYPTLAAGIPVVPPPNLSAGTLPLPNNLGTTTIPQTFDRGYFQTYNLTFQQEWLGFVGEAGYIGTRGIRVLTNYNINAANINTGNAGRLLNAALGKSWPDINQVTPYTNSFYDALQLRLNRRFRGNTNFGMTYTWSKAIDYEDNEELSSLLFPLPQNLGRNRAQAGFDRTSNFQIYGSYELPFGKGQKWATSGVASAIFGGWQVNSILSRVSGVPLTITGSATSLNAPGNTQTVNVVGPINIIGGIGPITGGKCPNTTLSCDYFNPTAFAPVTTATFGSAGRNIVRGPGFFNLDFSVFRNFKITERFTFQFRTEFFGATNTPHFGNPQTNITSSTFGQITSSTGQRQIWFAGKLIF